ncbi:GNAT family N-acetyltransferase [Streptomyces sp. NPDC052494]|uniref:GNAT family N-acetyltransferase n=1 Tax=Streptomyces sp. NPDC052494 TaxID=3365692 RepID=UPI0037D40815
MHGLHARPASNPFVPAPTAQMPPSGLTSAKHSRRSRISGRLRRRILAYRAIEFLSARIPHPSGSGEECLLLVHIRQVVGQVRYRICPDCARGVITAVIIDERFHGAGLGTRALSHLRSRHPTTAWRSTATRRIGRGLLRRMGIPAITSGTSCSHARPPLPGPVPTTS